MKLMFVVLIIIGALMVYTVKDDIQHLWYALNYPEQHAQAYTMPKE